jgi:hypothetical protein
MRGLFSQVASALAMPILIAMAGMAVKVAKGYEVNLGMATDFRGRYPQLVVYSLIVNVVGAIGTHLCCIPGLIFYALMIPGGLLVLEQRMEPVKAISVSLAAMKPHLGTGLGLIVACALAAVAGFALCVIPGFFTAPIYVGVQALVYLALFDDGSPMSWGGTPSAPPADPGPPSDLPPMG